MKSKTKNILRILFIGLVITIAGLSYRLQFTEASESLLTSVLSPGPWNDVCNEVYRLGEGLGGKSSILPGSEMFFSKISSQNRKITRIGIGLFSQRIKQGGISEGDSATVVYEGTLSIQQGGYSKFYINTLWLWATNNKEWKIASLTFIGDGIFYNAITPDES
jgi:hypothetical protein